MARYKVIINTDAYVCLPCSKKNWEAGTMNDFMIALNGWHTTENSLKQVMWRLKMFAGQGWGASEWDEDNQCIKKEYQKWRDKKCNTLTYFDRLCGFNRTHDISAYGFAQGYLDTDEVINKLKEDDSVKIPFEWLYDIRQKNYKSVKGCYMEITKIQGGK